MIFCQNWYDINPFDCRQIRSLKYTTYFVHDSTPSRSPVWYVHQTVSSFSGRSPTWHFLLKISMSWLDNKSERRFVVIWQSFWISFYSHDSTSPSLDRSSSNPSRLRQRILLFWIFVLTSFVLSHLSVSTRDIQSDVVWLLEDSMTSLDLDI